MRCLCSSYFIFQCFFLQFLFACRLNGRKISIFMNHVEQFSKNILSGNFCRKKITENKKRTPRASMILKLIEISFKGGLWGREKALPVLKNKNFFLFAIPSVRERINFFIGIKDVLLFNARDTYIFILFFRNLWPWIKFKKNCNQWRTNRGMFIVKIINLALVWGDFENYSKF